MTIDAQASGARADTKHPAQHRADVTAAPEPSAPGIAPGRRARPVLWWASLGAAAVAMQLYVYGRWVTSSNIAPDRKSVV